MQTPTKRSPSRPAFYVITAFMLTVMVVSFIGALSWIGKPFPGFLVFEFPFTGSMSMKDWPGRQAGVGVLQQIYSVNGQPVWHQKDVMDFVRQQAPGVALSYQIEKKGEKREFLIPVGVFSLRDFFFVFMIPFLGGVTIFCLGLVVFILKPDTMTSWVFFLFCLCVSLYGVSGFEIQSTYRLVKIHYLALCFLPATLFHFCLIFPERKKIVGRRPFLEYIVYLPALVFSLGYEIYIFDFVEIMRANALPWLPEYKTMASANRSFTLFCIASAVLFVIHSLIGASTIQARQRARMILFGISVAFGPPVVIMLLCVVFNFSFSWNFFAFFALFFPAAIAYSITRHNLFEADTIVKRTVGYVIVTLIVIGSYAAISIVLNTFVESYQFAHSRAFPIVFTLFFILVFNPLQRRVQSVVDRLFFRKEYDYGKVIDKIGSVVTSFVDLNRILQGLTQTFIQDMFIDNTSVMLLSPDGRTFQTVLCDGEDRDQIGEVNIPAEDPLIEIFDRDKRELTRFDMLESPRLRAIADKSLEYFDALKASLSIPLIYQDKVIGLLNVGEKKSGKMYRQEDIDLFNAAAKQGAVAIENARLFQENLEKQRMEEELNIARDLQTSMLPDTCPTVEGYDIAAFSIPAREVGGDFYDFAETRDGNLAFVVGDVTGKSVSGALVMAASRSIFRMLSEEAVGVSDVMVRANRRAKKDIKTGMFVALLYAVLDVPNKKLYLCSAGQTQPVYLSAQSGKAVLLETTGDTFPLGIIDEVDYQETILDFHSGDKIVLYTDGIVEAMNIHEEMFGFDRLVDIVQKNGKMEAEALLAEIRKQVDAFAGDAAQHDDLTVIVLSAI